MRSNTRCLAYLPDYESAATYFSKVPEVTRTGWRPNQRPLDPSSEGRRKHHYRIEKNGEDYEIILYHTVMGKYFKPEGDTRVVEYVGDGRMTSNQFMWHVLGISNRGFNCESEKGRVMVPFGWRRTTRLTLVDGVIDTTRSHHPTAGVYHMEDTIKQARKDMRKRLELAMHVVELRMDTFRREVEVGSRPFAYTRAAGGPFVKFDARLRTEPGDETFLSDFVEFAQEVYTFMVEKRNYDAETDTPPPEKNFKTALMNHALKAMGLARKEKFVELPPFMLVEEYPSAALVE